MHFFHEWEIVSRKNYKSGGGLVTIVLWECTHCKKLKTQHLDGEWSEELKE